MEDDNGGTLAQSEAAAKPTEPTKELEVFGRRFAGERGSEFADPMATFHFSSTGTSATGPSTSMVFDLLKQLHDHHEAKIAHYDNLRQGNIKFAFAIFAGLFGLAATQHVSPLQAMLVSLAIVGASAFLSYIDRYFHCLTHRAFFLKHYVLWKLEGLTNLGSSSKLEVAVYGVIDLEHVASAWPQKPSHLSRYYVVLMAGGWSLQWFFLYDGWRQIDHGFLFLLVAVGFAMGLCSMLAEWGENRKNRRR